MTKAIVKDLEGKKVKEIELPSLFNELYRPEVIRRAFLAERTWELQPKGTYRWAGLETSATYIARRRTYHTMMGRGISRVPRILLPKGGIGRARKIPGVVKGRRAHPPKTEKIIKEKINKKEYLLALRSAIANTKDINLIRLRNHIYEGELPIVVINDLEKINKTKDLINILNNLGIEKDLLRVKERIKRRSGTARRRGRVKRVPKSVLIIIGEDKGIKKAGSNIPGVDIKTVEELKVMDLSPGGEYIRLTIFTEDALKRIGELYG